jgi:hypothetical protein
MLLLFDSLIIKLPVSLLSPRLTDVARLGTTLTDFENLSVQHMDYLASAACVGTFYLNRELGLVRLAITYTNFLRQPPALQLSVLLSLALLFPRSVICLTIRSEA